MSATIAIVNNTITPGDFSLVTCSSSRRYLDDGYKAVSKTNDGWQFLKNNSPPDDKGFMFWGHPMVNKIVDNMETKDEHSGSSMAYVLRNMEFIAVNGWDTWCEKFIPPKINPGDFSFIENKSDLSIYKDAYDAISSVDGGWEFMKNNPPPKDKGYLFWQHPTITKIMNNMNLFGYHSGSSFAITMRCMEAIAIMGWDKWVLNYKETHKKYA